MALQTGGRSVKVVVAERDGIVPLAGLLTAAGCEVAEAWDEAGPRTVREVRDLGGVLEAARRLEADVVVVELRPGELRLVRDAAMPLPCPLLVVADREDESLLLAAVQIGAAGFVARDSSPPEVEPAEGIAGGPGRSFAGELAAAVVALDRGESAIPRRMLGGLLVGLIRWSHDHARVVRETDRLSARQRTVLLLLASGTNLATIAAALGVTVFTVRSHVQELLRRIGVHSRAEAVLWAARTGVLEHLRREADTLVPGGIR